MATKPTKRILDWASGGTATDPGAGKEASGWSISERPPAYWWNWILQSFGEWLGWSETSIDDIETALEGVLPKAVAVIQTGGSSGTEIWSAGTSITGITYSGNNVDVQFSSAFCTTTANAAVIPNVADSVDNTITWSITATDTVRLLSRDGGGSKSPTATTWKISFAVYGDA